MRQVFFLVLTLLVLQLFFPLVSESLSQVFLKMVEIANDVLDYASVQSTQLGG